MMTSLRCGLAMTLVALSLVGCAAESPTPTAAASRSQTVPPTQTPTPTPIDPIAGMSLADRVGQLFMVGTSVAAVDPVTMAAVTDQHIGGIFLQGRSSAGVASAAQFVSGFTAASGVSRPPLWVATDQEGGDVQVLSGPGFDVIPSALTQARSDDATLRADAARWGSQLAEAGVNMNLAPVADIVTSRETARSNPPIGRLNRQYGFDEVTVTSKAGAFAQGMRDAGVVPTLKHFPGLGHVNRNTDTSAGVVDDVVTTDGPDVGAYRALIRAGPVIIMMSTASYALIDPGTPAAFSPAVVTGLLRGQLGFDGVITTDDLSAAVQVKRWSPADRAILAIDAGVDLLLVSADATIFPEMYAAVLARAQSDPEFATKVDTAARRIVNAKAQAG